MKGKELFMKNKTNTFMQGIIALLFSQIMIKILGMIYSLYLTNKSGFGDEGNAIFYSAYCCENSRKYKKTAD